MMQNHYLQLQSKKVVFANVVKNQQIKLFSLFGVNVILFQILG